MAGGPTDLTRAVQGLGAGRPRRVAGHLQWGMTDWKSQGFRSSACPRSACTSSPSCRDEQPDLRRHRRARAVEWDEGHIDGAMHLPMGEAVRRLAEVPPDRPKAVLCAGGLRSSSVISALEREGMRRLVQRRPAA